MRTGTDECNLGAVNLDGQAGLDAGAELPDEGKPAASQRSTCCFQGYGKLQLALPAPTVVDVHVSEYGAVTFNRDEAKVAGFFVLYLDAELILVRADELHFARPLVCQRGYGMLSLYRAKNSTANVYYVR